MVGLACRSHLEGSPRHALVVYAGSHVLEAVYSVRCAGIRNLGNGVKSLPIY